VDVTTVRLRDLLGNGETQPHPTSLQIPGTICAKKGLKS
jgi:hypothetical protein